MRDARKIADSMDGIAMTILVPFGLYAWLCDVTEEDESNPLTERMAAFRDAYHASVLVKPWQYGSPSRMEIGDRMVREVLENLCYQLVDNPEASVSEMGAAQGVLIRLRNAGLLARKRCTKCDEIKPMKDYNWQSRAAGTRRPECGDCQREHYRQYRRERRGDRLARYAAPGITRTVETDAWDDEDDEDVYCPGCDRALPREAFWKHKRATNGLQPRCKACTDQRRRERAGKGTA